jgi:hypothetical protein
VVVQHHRQGLVLQEEVQVGSHNQQIFGGDHIYHQVLVVLAPLTDLIVQLQEVFMAVVVLVVLADLMVAALDLVNQVVLEELLLDIKYSII